MLNTWVLVLNGQESSYVLNNCVEFSFEFKYSVKDSFTVFDTFDRRFLRRQNFLFHCNSHFHLLKPENKRYQYEYFSGECEFFLPMNLTDEYLKQSLSPASIRAVIPICTMDAQMDKVYLRNSDEKIIATCTEYSIQSSRNIFGFMIAEPLKGYEDETKAAVKLLKSFGIDRSEGDFPVVFTKKFPAIENNYSNKIQTRLAPEYKSSDALTAIIRELLEKIDSNIDGIKNDYDTEFLHDFRVSIRRSRAILGEMKKIFEPAKTKHCRGLLRTFAKMTNEIRDTDVYLLKLPSFKEKLKPKLRRGMDKIEQYLLQKRAEEFSEIYHFLSGNDFKNNFDDLTLFFEKEYKNFPGEYADSPVYDTALTAVEKSLKKIVKSSQRLKSSSSEEYLHKLRIDCKKLRYLLEAFGSMLYGKKSDDLIKKLKGLQDNIGSFHDNYVHSLMLDKLLENLPESDKVTDEAVAYLKKTFSEEQKGLKKKIYSQLNEFVSEKSLKTFR